MLCGGDGTDLTGERRMVQQTDAAVMMITAAFCLLAVSLFDLLNGIAEQLRLGGIFHLSDLLFHLDNHPARIRLAHRLEHKGQQVFHAGNFQCQFLNIVSSGKIRGAHFFTSMECSRANRRAVDLKSAEYITSQTNVRSGYFLIESRRSLFK